MKKMLFIAILSCLGSMAFAQKVYFVYIQSEAGTPFYVKMGEKVYSSTASGYVILPKLKDSTYSLYLGQPGSQVKELRFNVSINNADHGFLLKNFQNEWGLFDLQSMAVINPTPSTSGVMYDSNSVKSDRFTRLLAKAVNDSTLLMEPALAKAEPKETKKEEIKKKAAKDKDGAVAKVSEDSAKGDIAVNTPVTESVPVATSSVADNSLAADSNALKETANKETSGNDTVVKSEVVAAKQTITPSETVVPQETSVPAETVTTKDTAPSKDTFAVKETAVSVQAASDETSTPKDVVVQNDQKTDSGEMTAGTPEQTEFKRSVVKKYAESSNFQGFGLTFVDTWEGITDTIRLVIPNLVDASALVRTEQPKPGEQAKAANKVPDQITRATLPSADNKTSAPDTSIQAPGPVVANSTSIPNTAKADDSVQTTDAKDVAASSNCKEEASNKDFLELRKNMASKDRGEEMLDEARNAFKEKCYTTEQIRKLSVLFYTQEGKFLFFKDAKPFVSDKDRFSTLLFEFRDDAYQERFKSLLEN